MGKKSSNLLILTILCSVFFIGCSHSLEVKNLQDFNVPPPLPRKRGNLKVAVKPYEGGYGIMMQL